MTFSFLRSPRFLFPAAIALAVTGLLFTWELNGLASFGLPGPPRFPPSTREVILAALTALFFSLNTGLIAWHRGCGTCPVGMKRASGAGGALGALALLCPACLLIPTGIAGLGISLGLLAPFAPAIQIIALVLLCASLWLLVPK